MKIRIELEEDQTARFREAAISGDFILASSKIHKQGTGMNVCTPDYLIKIPPYNERPA